jgi:hypothetical protein
LASSRRRFAVSLNCAFVVWMAWAALPPTQSSTRFCSMNTPTNVAMTAIPAETTSSGMTIWLWRCLPKSWKRMLLADHS